MFIFKASKPSKSNNNNKDSDLPHCWLPARSQSLRALMTSSSSSSSSTVSQRRQRLITSIPTSALYDLVLDMNWHRVIRHCRSNPVDAEYQHIQSAMETPLHLACKLRPSVRVIRELLQASSRMACEIATQNGELPLHIACRYNASIQVLRELTRTHPEIVRQQEKNINGIGKTALQALWDARESTRSNRDESEDYNSIFWQKVIVLLQAVARGRQIEQGGLSTSRTRTSSSSSSSRLYLLHAAVSLGSDGCPREVLDYCLQQYLHQVAQRDASGRLPLHIAVAVRPSCQDHQQQRLPRIAAAVVDVAATDHYQTSVISKLLALYPRAAKIPDPNEPIGRYPLHSAIANQIAWQQGVSDLFEEAPDVICMPDPVSRLLPFLSAAAVGAGPPVHVGRSTATPSAPVHVDLDSIYLLLRELPSALDADLAAQAPAVVTIMEEEQEEEEENPYVETCKATSNKNCMIDDTERTMDESTEFCFDDSVSDHSFSTLEVQQQPSSPLFSSSKSPMRLPSSSSSSSLPNISKRCYSSSSIKKEPPIQLPRVQRADHRELCDDVVQRIASSGLFGAMRRQKARSNLLK